VRRIGKAENESQRATRLNVVIRRVIANKTNRRHYGVRDLSSSVIIEVK
jgi:hypothetical protein